MVPRQSLSALLTSMAKQFEERHPNYADSMSGVRHLFHQVLNPVVKELARQVRRHRVLRSVSMPRQAVVDVL